MFGMFGSKPSNKMRVMGHEVEVASIMRGGEVLFTSDTVKAYPKTHMEGQIIEVVLWTRTGAPFFAYYLCKDYYLAVVSPAGPGAFGGPMKTEEFRTAVSQQVGRFVVQHAIKVLKLDIRDGLFFSGFRHNRAHTNVLAFVTKLGDWYPIQHCDAEDDDATERKVAAVNRGAADITEVVAVQRESPHANNF